MSEMTPSAIELAVVVARLDDLRADVQSMRNEIRDSRRDFVGRGEWEMRNRAVDSRFEGQGREIAELKAARAPWWSWATVILAIGSLALNAIPRLAG